MTKRKKNVHNTLMKVEADTKSTKMEEESKREGEKMILEWKTLQNSYKRKKEESMPSEGLKGANLQWCKYTVMKRRTESMLDISEKKGALTPGFHGAKPRQTKCWKRGREKRVKRNLLKKVLDWNHIKSENF